MVLRSPFEWVHCDWSLNQKKRWMVRGRVDRSGASLGPAEPVDSDPLTLFRATTPLLIGFDVPFGLPFAYAERVDCDHFVAWLRTISQDPAWASFYRPATRIDEIEWTRPFYPARPGGTKRSHLTERLRVDSIDALRRRCDRATDHRGAAAPLFWTMGAQQVGKAAITVWRDLVSPALLNPEIDICIWPFDGELQALIQAHQIVVCEAYPAEFYHQLGVRFERSSQRPWGKRVQADRKNQASRLYEVAAELDLDLDPALISQIESGFGDDAAGEDRFDATVGALGMARVIWGHQEPGEPQDSRLRAIEGTLLGLDHRFLL